MTTQMWPIWPSGDPQFDMPGLQQLPIQTFKFPCNGTSAHQCNGKDVTSQISHQLPTGHCFNARITSGWHNVHDLQRHTDTNWPNCQGIQLRNGYRTTANTWDVKAARCRVSGTGSRPVAAHKNTRYRTGTRPRLQTCTQQVSGVAAAATVPTRRITAITMTSRALKPIQKTIFTLLYAATTVAPSCNTYAHWHTHCTVPRRSGNAADWATGRRRIFLFPLRMYVC